MTSRAHFSLGIAKFNTLSNLLTFVYITKYLNDVMMVYSCIIKLLFVEILIFEVNDLLQLCYFNA